LYPSDKPNREICVDLSDYQIMNVIRTYVKSLRGKVNYIGSTSDDQAINGEPSLQDEGMRKMVFGRIEEIVSEKAKRRET